MLRSLAAAAVFLALVPIGPAAQAPSESSKPVVFDAVALNRAGLPVMDLKPDDFKVRIGHFTVPIESVTVETPASGDQTGRLIVLLLDNITVAPVNIPRVRDVALRFVDKLAPGDRMAVVFLDGGQMEATDEPAVLRGAIERYNTHRGFTTRDGLGQEVLQTISQVARGVMEAPGRRKTIVGVGSGWVFDRPIPTPMAGAMRDLRPEWTDAMRAMAYAKANLYVIDPGGVGSAGAYSGDIGFARETGGYAFVNTNDFKGSVDRILDEASNYYVIAVPDPPTGRGADLRELEVTTPRRGVTIRARHAIPGS